MPSISRVEVFGMSTWHQYRRSMLNRPCPVFTCRVMPAPMLTTTNPYFCFVPQLDPRAFNPGEPPSSTSGCKLHAVRRRLIFTYRIRLRLHYSTRAAIALESARCSLHWPMAIWYLVRCPGELFASNSFIEVPYLKARKCCE